MSDRTEIEDLLLSEAPETAGVTRLLHNRHFWIASALFIVGVLLNYPQQLLGMPSGSLFGFAGADTFSIERIYLLLPVLYSGFTLGLAGGIAGLSLAVLIMMPRALFLADNRADAALQSVAIMIMGVMFNVWLGRRRREQQRSEQVIQTLEVAKQEVQHYIRAIENSEKALATINAVCLVATQSLDLQKVLDTTVERVRDVLDLDVALAFLLNENTRELELCAWRGVSREFVAGLKGLKAGEGFNGRVVETGEPLLVVDSQIDPRLTREVVRTEGLLSQIIVPLKTKDKVVGTLTVAGRYSRPFRDDEVDLLTTIGRQVGVAIENSRLYQQERLLADEQRGMQEKLRYYLQQVTRAQEEERQRIAQELHDATIQDLVLLLHKIDRFSVVASYLPPQEVIFLEEMRQRIHVIADEVRRFTQDLRPSVLDDLGLLPALEWLASDVSRHFDIKVNFSTSGQVRRFAPETELTLFRIVQEALRNVWKHSGATEAGLTVDFMGGLLRISVTDNGKGFDPPASPGDLAVTGKLGLVGMAERARLIGARLQVESQPGHGATVTVELTNPG